MNDVPFKNCAFLRAAFIPILFIVILFHISRASQMLSERLVHHMV